MGTIQKDSDNKRKLKLKIWINLPQNVVTYSAKYSLSVMKFNSQTNKNTQIAKDKSYTFKDKLLKQMILF
jgi:hypothetical protein